MTITNAVITAYCCCQICCGNSSPGINAAGKRPIQGISIAGPRSLPLGTRIRIAGMTNEFILDDRTAKKYDGRFDIYFSSHAEARQFGIRRGATITVNPKKK